MDAEPVIVSRQDRLFNLLFWWQPTLSKCTREPLTLKSERTHGNWKCRQSPPPSIFGVRSPKIWGRLKLRNCQGRSQSSFFPSLHHSVLLILSLPDTFPPFLSTPSLIFSFHVYCMSLFHSCSTHYPVSINPLKQSPDCRLRYYSFSGEMEWVEEKKGDSQMYNSISISPVNQTPGLHWPPSSTQKQKRRQRQVRDIKREGKRPIRALWTPPVLKKEFVLLWWRQS